MKPAATESSMIPVKHICRFLFTKMIKRIPTSCLDTSWGQQQSAASSSCDRQKAHLLVSFGLITQGSQDGNRPGIFPCGSGEIEKRFRRQVGLLQTHDEHVWLKSRSLSLHRCKDEIMGHHVESVHKNLLHLTPYGSVSFPTKLISLGWVICHSH